MPWPAILIPLTTLAAWSGLVVVGASCLSESISLRARYFLVAALICIPVCICAQAIACVSAVAPGPLRRAVAVVTPVIAILVAAYGYGLECAQGWVPAAEVGLLLVYVMIEIFAPST